ncbi:MAG: hypothetical protein ACJAVK_002901 [Akkermansiaceae bacterium]|jgi:hypothetical protein
MPGMFFQLRTELAELAVTEEVLAMAVPVGVVKLHEA